MNQTRQILKSRINFPHLPIDSSHLHIRTKTRHDDSAATKTSKNLWKMKKCTISSLELELAELRGPAINDAGSHHLKKYK